MTNNAHDILVAPAQNILIDGVQITGCNGRMGMKDIIDSLIAKFHAMSDLCKAFENENGILKEQLMHQKQEMQALQSKYEELEKRYGNLKLSKTVAGQDGSSTEETKVRFARLVREIDKCISLLNE